MTKALVEIDHCWYQDQHCPHAEDKNCLNSMRFIAWCKLADKEIYNPQNSSGIPIPEWCPKRINEDK